MYFRQPKYFADFQCIGNACQDNCCYKWRIDLTTEEVEKIKGAKDKMSPELSTLIDTAFVPQDNVEGYSFKINLDPSTSRCPLLTENGLCRLQKEIGAEYLCMTYPRNHIIAAPVPYRFCHITCGEVLRNILRKEDSMDLINIEEKGGLKSSTGKYRIQTENNPELKYYTQIFEFFYEIISDKKRAVEDSIILGALAAQALTKCVEQNDLEKIPEIIKSLRKQTHNGAQLKKINEIKPNYNVKLGILGQLMELISKIDNLKSMTETLKDNEKKFNIDLYDSGEELLREYLSTKPFAMRNIALSLLFEHCVPFRNHDFTIFENYAVYVTTFALTKLNAIAVAELQNRVSEEEHKDFRMDDFLIRSTGFITRPLCQGLKTDQHIMKALKGNNMLSPAYLALLVK